MSSDATICATRRSSRGTRVSRCSLSTEHATDGLWVCKSLSSRHILFDVSCKRLRLMRSIFCSLLATNRTWHRSDSAKLFDSTIHSKACCWFFRTEQQQQWQSRCSNSNSNSSSSSHNSISSNNNSSSSYNVSIVAGNNAGLPTAIAVAATTAAVVATAAVPASAAAAVALAIALVAAVAQQ